MEFLSNIFKKQENPPAYDEMVTVCKENIVKQQNQSITLLDCDKVPPYASGRINKQFLIDMMNQREQTLTKDIYDITEKKINEIIKDTLENKIMRIVLVTTIGQTSDNVSFEIIDENLKKLNKIDGNEISTGPSCSGRSIIIICKNDSIMSTVNDFINKHEHWAKYSIKTLGEYSIGDKLVSKYSISDKKKCPRLIFYFTHELLYNDKELFSYYSKNAIQFAVEEIVKIEDELIKAAENRSTNYKYKNNSVEVVYEYIKFNNIFDFRVELSQDEINTIIFSWT
ncbi:MAG: hypothetical protein Terrestrivirus13_14 [Terrestrivirus sp.]|uniref:Uncharacterized protein n=1 Tax=Terrestrivirus sp. TaxID=2487775 RepID=A0A3G4ZPD0_9VIRU|nr:MAG: hypothetical protein Terrestrivirus13_14 [Terrestrivirus sp.]